MKKKASTKKEKQNCRDSAPTIVSTPVSKKKTGQELKIEKSFIEVVQLIEKSKQKTYQAINTALIDLYWQVGQYISQKLQTAEWGEGVVDELACYIAKTQSNLRGFSRRGLFRMKQFYETYHNDNTLSSKGMKEKQIVSTVLTQLSWSHNLLIMAQCKRAEEREFYLRLASQERWSVRELQRQIKSAHFERAVLNPLKTSEALKKAHPEVETIFKDSYLFEFLGLPVEHSEADLHAGLLRHLGRFLTELGRDFCFIGSEYPLQVGNQDFAIDLLFFHRGLSCLVAIELKAGRFEPEYLGKLEFYLEALDRDVRKPHERPSIGVLLCATKDNQVVEYALNRSLSPTLIAEYQSILPDKKLFQAKLEEYYQLLAPSDTKSEEKKQPIEKNRKKKGSNHDR